jgi:hypothetical protein
MDHRVDLGLVKRQRILTVDWECLPGHWIGADYTSRIVTALAWSWSDQPDVINVMTHYDYTRPVMADEFGLLCAAADVVTGHWVTGFDLPVGNGARLRENLPPMQGTSWASDTKAHLSKTSGRSLSQQNLAASLGCKAPKIQVTLKDWEEFNLRTPGYREAGEERVVGDVRQHQEMRAKLIELGWLTAPQRWMPNVRVAGFGRYHA